MYPNKIGRANGDEPLTFMTVRTTVPRPGLTRADRLPALMAPVFCAAAVGTAARTARGAPSASTMTRRMPTSTKGSVA